RRHSAKADSPFVKVFASLRDRNQVDGESYSCCDVCLPFLVGGASVRLRRIALFPHVDFLDLRRDTARNKLGAWNAGSTKQKDVWIEVPAGPIDHCDEFPDRFVNVKNSCLGRITNHQQRW